MLHNSRILCRALSHGALAAIGGALLLAASGCGQTGALYLPTEAAAAQRATLPQSLWPVMPARDKDTATPAAPAPLTPPPSVPPEQNPASR